MESEEFCDCKYRKILQINNVLYLGYNNRWYIMRLVSKYPSGIKKSNKTGYKLKAEGCRIYKCVFCKKLLPEKDTTYKDYLKGVGNDKLEYDDNDKLEYMNDILLKIEYRKNQIKDLENKYKKLKVELEKGE